MKFNKGKYQVLPLCRNNSMLEANWLESSSTEKDVEILGDHKLSLSQQRILVVKKSNRLLGCIRNSVANRQSFLCSQTL